MKIYRKCPVCQNGDDIELLYKQEFLIPEDYEGLPEIYYISECSCCGFIYANINASQTAYNRFYERNSKYENTDLPSSTGGISESDLARFEIAFNEFKIFIRLDSQILDLGCANGGFLHVLKTKGFCNVAGLDMSKQCVANVKALGIECCKGGLFDFPENFINRFDLIILSHVLEHIYDIEIAMQNISHMLKDNGMVYIEVPDASRYHDFYIKPFYYFDLEHINHFDKQALTNLAGSFGFETVFACNKDVQASKKYKYPTVSVLLKKRSGMAAVLEKKCNEGIRKYISISHKHDVRLRETLNELIVSQEPVIIWGIGAWTLNIFKKGLLECNLAAIVDSDVKKRGMMINGLKVQGPSIIHNFKATILILPALFEDEITKQIIEMDTENQIKSIYK